MNNNSHPPHDDNHQQAIAQSKQMLEQPWRWFGVSLFVALIAIRFLAPKSFIDDWWGLLVILVGLVVSYANPIKPLVQKRWLRWVFAHVNDLVRFEKEAFRRGWLKNQDLAQFTDHPKLTQQLAVPINTAGNVPLLPETSAFYFNPNRLLWWKDQTVLMFGLLFGVGGIVIVVAGLPVVVWLVLALATLGWF